MLGSFGANWGQGYSWGIKVETSRAPLSKVPIRMTPATRRTSTMLSAAQPVIAHQAVALLRSGMLRYVAMGHSAIHGVMSKGYISIPSIPHCELHSTVIMILSCSFCLMVHFNIIRLEVWVEQNCRPSWNKPRDEGSSAEQRFFLI